MELLFKILQLPFVEAILTALVIAIGAKTVRSIHRRPLRRIWNPIVGKQKTIHLILPSFKLASFHIEIANSDSPIPDNVVLMPFAEALGISDLKRTLEKLYPKKRVILHDSDRFTDFKESFISIGGPSINRVTHELVSVRKIDKGFSIHYPAHAAEDTVPPTAVYSPQKNGNMIIEDYGFIIISDNPFDTEKRVCIVFGVWANGTNSAIQSLIGVNDSAKNIGTYVRKHRNVLVTTRSNVTGVFTGLPEIAKMRPLRLG